MIKKLLLVLASLFLAYQSVALLQHPAHLQSLTWWGNLGVAWIINMFVTGVFALSGFALPTQKLLPAHYYHIHRPVHVEAAVRLMYIKGFQAFLLATFWRSKAQQKRFFSGTRTGLLEMKTASEKAEFGHVSAFVALVGVSIYLGLNGCSHLAGWVMLWNVLGNAYPAVLQRYHRMRIQPILARWSGPK